MSVFLPLNHAVAETALISKKASTTLLLDIERAGSRLVAIGQRGHIVYSDDGVQWSQASVPSTVLLTGVFFLNEKLGWAVGHESTILKTKDAGVTWVAQNHTPFQEEEEVNYDEPPSGKGEPFFDVHFLDANKGYAVGAFGYALKTEDGGDTWADASTSIDNFEASHYYFLNKDKDGALWLGGEMGSLFYSDDQGDSWRQLASPYPGSFFGVTSFKQYTYVYGLEGQIYRTNDAGETWQSIPSNTAQNINSGAVLSAGKLVLVGNKGVVLTSNEQGDGFTLRNEKNRQSLLAAASVDNKNIAVGESGAVVIE